MRNHLKPKLVRIIDKRGDELLHRTKETIEGDRAALKADQDWQTVCRLDAVDIPDEPKELPASYGRISAAIFLMIAAFIAGLVVGRMA